MITSAERLCRYCRRSMVALHAALVDKPLLFRVEAARQTTGSQNPAFCGWPRRLDNSTALPLAAVGTTSSALSALLGWNRPASTVGIHEDDLHKM